LAPSRKSQSWPARPSRSDVLGLRWLAFLVLLGLSFPGLCGSAHAQNAFVNVTFTPAGAQDGTKITPSFTLPTQSSDVKDSVDEFQRFVKHEAWDKAFKSLETIASKTSAGYMDRSDGVLVPSKVLSRSL